MKRLNQILMVAIAAVALFGARPAHASMTFGSPNDPTYSRSISTGTTITLSTTSPSVASTVVAATTTALAPYNNLFVVVTATGNVGGNMDLYLQTSPDFGATWADYAHLPTLSTGAAQINYAFTVSRGSPTRTAPIQIGTGTSVAISSNTVLGGDFGDRMRVVIVSGNGTTSGNSQTVRIYASY